MTGNYSGNLVRTWASAEESANFAPDPAHGTPRGHDTGTPQEYPTTDMVPADLGSEYAGTKFPDDVMAGGGIVLGTPSRSHGGLGGRRMVHTDDQHRESLRVRHSEDGQRRYLHHKYTLPPEQDSHEFLYDTYEESDPIYAHANNTGATGPMRGIDGNPQNNPPTRGYPAYGMRPGWFRRGPWTAADRRLGRRKYRYEAQPLIERDYYVPFDQPDQGGGPDILPFKLFKQAGTNTMFKQPGIHRSPDTVDSSWLAMDQEGYGPVIGGGLAG